jgi:uncharacterized zinc-type alcohol dehydrogenase-like protein
MARVANSLDLILDTVSAPHDLSPLVNSLRRDGTIVLLGGNVVPHPVPPAMAFIFTRKRLAGSLIGGLPETQEMLDFCGEHGIVSDIELIDAKDINTAYERMLKSDVKYRFVIDIATIGA